MSLHGTILLHPNGNLDIIHDLLQPSAHHTNTTSAKHSTTIAMVIPVLKELILKQLELEQLQKDAVRSIP